MGEVFNSPLSFHCCPPVRLGFEIHHHHRAPAAGVAGSDPLVVLLQAPLGVDRPAGVERAISALQNIAKVISVITFIFYLFLIVYRFQNNVPRKMGIQ